MACVSREVPLLDSEKSSERRQVVIKLKKIKPLAFHSLARGFVDNRLLNGFGRS